MNFEIRPMQAADLDALGNLAANTPEAPQWRRSVYALYLAPDPANPALLRAALVGTSTSSSAILGFGCATLVLDGTDNLCQLDTLAVHPDARRQGIGAALLRGLLGWAARHGARHFSLEVRASNVPALALYHRLGLRAEGRRTRYYADPEEDALLLGTPVTAGTG